MYFCDPPVHRNLSVITSVRDTRLFEAKAGLCSSMQSPLCEHTVNGCAETVTDSFWISQLDDFCIADSLLQIIHLFSSLDVSQLSGFSLTDKVGWSLLQIKQGAFYSCTNTRSQAVTYDTEDMHDQLQNNWYLTRPWDKTI